jgi:retron-type reverse transcriptase
MKRYGNLWDGMISFENLLRAAEKARRGKRFRPPAARFFFHLERELWRLHEELVAKTYRPGPYRTFKIYEAKKRQISAAPFRDRVVHHALTGILEPIFERSFIHDSYACRKGKGTHAAVDRCQEFVRRFRYVLKADVRKYFPSIDHAILKGLVARKIKDPHVLWLVGKIIDHSNPQDPVLMWFPGDDLFTPTERRRGLPLGNQTSQFLANVYLDPLDHFVTDHLGLSYVRYVDDFLVFANDKRRLHEVKGEIEHFLETLRLQIHRHKSVVFPCHLGIRFLGFRVFPTHRLIAKENVRRFRRRMRWMQREYTNSRIGFDAIRPRIMSWIGHARHANTYRLRTDLFRRMTFQRAVTKSSSPPGRDVQQSTGERPLGEP